MKANGNRSPMNLKNVYAFSFCCLLSFWQQASAITISEGKEVKPVPTETAAPRTSSNYSGYRHLFFIGLDTFTRSISKTTHVESGSYDLFSPIQFPLLFSYYYKLDNTSELLFQLDYTVFPKSGADGGTQETHLLLRIPYVRQFNNSILEWKSGFALHQTTIKGGSGTTILNNGNSTATFYIPDSSTVSNSILAEVGLVYPYKKFIFESSLLLESPLNSKTRNFSFLLGVSYQIGAL